MDYGVNHLIKFNQKIAKAYKLIAPVYNCPSELEKHIDTVNNILKAYMKLIPFKKGDRVKLIKEIDFKKAHGWASSSHWMIPGATGRIAEIKIWQDGGISYMVVWDNQSWLKKTWEGGKEVHTIMPYPRKEWKMFIMSPEYIEKVKK